VAKFSIGDLVVLKSGSMRMCVESVDDETVSTVWCNEGVIGRDRFDTALLNKWEYREDSGEGGRGRGGPRGGREDREGGGRKPYRDRGEREERGDRGDRGGDRGGDERPRKTGWNGKPRQKKYFRKDED